MLRSLVGSEMCIRDRYWMIGVGDVRLLMSVFDVGWMCTACCDLGRVVNGVGTESVSWLVDVVFR